MSAYGSVNPALLDLARTNIARFAKEAFVPGGDPSMGGGDPSQGGGDPSMGGGDPAMGGGDPSMMAGGGGAAPPQGGGSDPTAGVQGPSSDLSTMIQQQVQAAVQNTMGMGGGMGGGGMGGGMGAGPKMKIDENIVQLQQLKLLAKICDTLGISIPASEMVVTPGDLQAQAQAAQGGGGAAGGAAGGAQQSAIKPIQPMQAAAPQPGGGAPGGEKVGSDFDSHPTRQQGQAFDTRGLARVRDKAAAYLRIRGRRGSA